MDNFYILREYLYIIDACDNLQTSAIFDLENDYESCIWLI